MRDPYSTLGVPKSANESDIKSAFRKLAKQFHPDQNADDPRAQEKFAAVNSAYEIIGDKDKRGQFDRGEIDAEGKPLGFGPGNPFGGNPFGGGFSGSRRQAGQRGNQNGSFSAEDILSEIFGGTGQNSRDGFAGNARSGNPFGQDARTSQASAKGDDISVTLHVSLSDLASTEKVRVTLPTQKTLSVALPAGVEDGQVIRLKGQGAQSAFGKAGDALITISIKVHPAFRRDGDILRLDLPVTLYEAVLGAKVTVPTIGGQVALGIPKGANGGQVLRIKGRGIIKKDSTRGDILATLRIILPDNGSSDLETMMQVWRDQRPYNVRDSSFS